MAGLVQRAQRAYRAFSDDRQAVTVARSALGGTASRHAIAQVAAHQKGIIRWNRARMAESKRFMPGFEAGGAYFGPNVDVDTSRGGRGMLHWLGNRQGHDLDQEFVWRRAEGIMLSYRNPFANKAANLQVEFSIGNGLNINPKGPKRRKGQRVATQTTEQKMFRDWYRTTAVDALDKKAGFEIEKQILTTAIHQTSVLVWFVRTDEATDSEMAVEAYSRDPVISRRRSQRRTPRDVPLAVRVLSTQQLADDLRTPSREGHYLVNGVEYDEWGAEFGFWIRPNKHHMGGGFGAPFFVAKYDNDRLGGVQMFMLQIGDPMPGQMFPVPPGCLILDTVLDAGDLTSNVVTRTRTEARQAHHITMGEEASQSWRGLKGEEYRWRPAATDEQIGEVDPVTGEDLDPVPVNPEMADLTDEQFDKELAAIIASLSEQLMSESEVPVLPNGWSIHSTPLTNATPSIELLRLLYRIVAIAYRVPYALLTDDASQANFSSNKIVLIPFQRRVEYLQEMMMGQYAYHLTRAFTYVAWSVGKFRSRSVDWSIRANRFPSIDPEADLNATISKLANRLTTLRRVWEENGDDPDEMEADIEEQEAFLERIHAFDRALPFTKSAQFLIDQSGGKKKAGDDVLPSAQKKPAETPKAETPPEPEI